MESQAWEARIGRAISETDEERVRQGDTEGTCQKTSVDSSEEKKKETNTMRRKIFDSQAPTRDFNNNSLEKVIMKFAYIYSPKSVNAP